jgi:hypothetical protein
MPIPIPTSAPEGIRAVGERHLNNNQPPEDRIGVRRRDRYRYRNNGGFKKTMPMPIPIPIPTLAPEGIRAVGESH